MVLSFYNSVLYTVAFDIGRQISPDTISSIRYTVWNLFWHRDGGLIMHQRSCFTVVHCYY